MRAVCAPATGDADNEAPGWPAAPRPGLVPDRDVAVTLPQASLHRPPHPTASHPASPSPRRKQIPECVCLIGRHGVATALELWQSPPRALGPTRPRCTHLAGALKLGTPRGAGLPASVGDLVVTGGGTGYQQCEPVRAFGNCTGLDIPLPDSRLPRMSRGTRGPGASWPKDAGGELWGGAAGLSNAVFPGSGLEGAVLCYSQRKLCCGGAV